MLEYIHEEKRQARHFLGSTLLVLLYMLTMFVKCEIIDNNLLSDLQIVSKHKARTNHDYTSENSKRHKQ